MKLAHAFASTLVAAVIAVFARDASADLPHWRGAVLADRPMRSVLRAATPEAREQANVASNVLLYSMVAAPIFNAAANVSSRGNFQNAASLLLIDAETFGVTFALVALIKAATARERPYASAAGLSSRCVEHPEERSCKGDRNASFFSGHSATAFAGAGLLCMQQMELGPRFAGIGCGSAMTLAGATALLRIIADKHYATDTLVGALVGLGTGMLLPYAMHYASWAPLPIARQLQDDRAQSQAPITATNAASAFQIAPWGTPGGEGIAFGFTF